MSEQVDIRARAEAIAKILTPLAEWVALGWKGQAQLIDMIERALLDGPAAQHTDEVRCHYCGHGKHTHSGDRAEDFICLLDYCADVCHGWNPTPAPPAAQAPHAATEGAG